jgi:hypothetical protein
VIQMEREILWSYPFLGKESRGNECQHLVVSEGATRIQQVVV